LIVAPGKKRVLYAPKSEIIAAIPADHRAFLAGLLRQTF